MFRVFVLSVVLCALCSSGLTQQERVDVKQQPDLSKLVRNWAEKLGGELWHLGELVTRRNMVIDSYKHNTIVREDGDTLLKDIHEKISLMMKEKVKAVQRIMEVAENSAVAQGDYVDPSYDFYNAKNLTNSADNCSTENQEMHDAYGAQTLELRTDFKVYDYVSFNRHRKAIHREQNQEDDLLEAEEMDLPDGDGLDVSDGSGQDPLASQTPPEDKRKLPLYCNRNFYNLPVNTNYSAVHVPSNVYERSKEVIKGIKWSEELDKTFRNNYKEDPTLSWQYFGSSTGFMRQFPALIWPTDPIDLFDCRTRSWYIEAASSPKDVVILVDRSGSMTGMRREIARHVVHNILDTLGNNDYVNIFTFSNTTDPLVECFDNILVQANLANVRLLKESMSEFRTEQIANFSLALTTAFELLQDYRLKRKGAICNQAIMLVTDGVQYNFKEIFSKYNWQNLPFMPVRVFTYLIGREVSDVREVKWMACANQGYYVHLSTYAEVREEVLKYVPVMARPMVLNPSRKPNPTWSPVYADVTDPKLTNWLWINRQRNKQRDIFLMYRRNRTLFNPDEQDRKYVHQQKLKQDNYGELQSYRLMTSVSLPVYDRRENATRVANLLGVAGTDVPIENIQVLTLPYRLGVNGYAFIVTNNGYILIHPDLRPVFQGILKPAYNRIDVVEVEIMDDGSEPREFSDAIRELRRKVVLQEKGNVSLNVKTHLDDMRRIVIGQRHYFYMGIEGTPFSLVVALPHKYGFYRVQHLVPDDDIHRLRSNDKVKDPLLQFFTGNWTIHPEWRYCRYLDDKYQHNFESPKEELIHFLQKIEAPAWKWSRECDRRLLCNVVADAKYTSWFSQNTTSKEDNGIFKLLCCSYHATARFCRTPYAVKRIHEFLKRFGITVAFLATHSGLTRWQDFPQNIDRDGEDRNVPHFHQLYNRAIDEIWYKRAVEQHYVDPRSFVYSVPFDVGAEEGVLVTASHAIFKEDGPKKAPAAVVGFQFYHSALQTLFNKTTTTCGEISCKRTCASEELYCVVLDDNGYVILSDSVADTGRFFGEIRADIMNLLVSEGIYKSTRMYDYQATCFAPRDSGNFASKFLTLHDNFIALFQWVLVNVFNLVKVVSTEFYENNDNNTDMYEARRVETISPRPCDQETHLYTYTHTQHKDFDGFWLEAVPFTNLVLLVINDLVNFVGDVQLEYPTPKEVVYNVDVECIRAGGENLIRRNYMECFNQIIIDPLKHLAQLSIWLFSTLTKSISAIDAGGFFSSDTIEDISTDQPPTLANEKEFDQRLLVKKTRPEPCDQEFYLYTLVYYTERNISSSGYNRTMSDNCTRPYIVQPVVSSNMILLVINNICPEEKDVDLPTPEPVEIDYNMTLACFRELHNNFTRRHYMSCINRHINEQQIKLCGTGSMQMSSMVLIVLSTLLFVLFE